MGASPVEQPAARVVSISAQGFIFLSAIGDRRVTWFRLAMYIVYVPGASCIGDER